MHAGGVHPDGWTPASAGVYALQVRPVGEGSIHMHYRYLYRSHFSGRNAVWKAGRQKEIFVGAGNGNHILRDPGGRITDR